MTGTRRKSNKLPFMERVMGRIEPEPNTGCWLWTGSQGKSGHGHITEWKNGKPSGRPAHRVIYEYLVGTIPEGLTLGHLCRMPMCVNPKHLEPVTSRVNTLRSPIAPAAINSRKTHCNHGHPFQGSNLAIAADGSRLCRSCRNSSEARYREKKAKRLSNGK